MTLRKVSSKLNLHKVAGAISGSIREDGRAELQTIGAGSSNHAIKAISVTRSFFTPKGIDLICTPGLLNLEIDGKMTTVIRLYVEEDPEKTRLYVTGRIPQIT